MMRPSGELAGLELTKWSCFLLYPYSRFMESKSYSFSFILQVRISKIVNLRINLLSARGKNFAIIDSTVDLSHNP